MSTLAERIAPAKKPARPATKGAGLKAALFLVLALVAAAAAGVLFKRYLQRGASATAIPLSKVVVAIRAIPAGATLEAAELKSVDWPRADLPQGALHDAGALVGRVTLSELVPGEPLFESLLASTKAGRGLAALLPPTMRAVAVRVDDVVGVAGFIHPGDRVDVLVTMKPEDETDVPPVSRVILQNVSVLAVGTKTDRDEKKLNRAVPVTVATLMVDSADAERLALATTRGKILLALRSRLDAGFVRTSGVDPELLLGDVWRDKRASVLTPPASHPRTRHRRRRAPVAAAPVRPGSENVEILRGDRFETRRFQTEGGKP